jgi:hypothetical protein
VAVAAQKARVIYAGLVEAVVVAMGAMGRIAPLLELAILVAVEVVRALVVMVSQAALA